MKDSYDVVVVGSGAGGGVVAGELAQRGRDVLLLECGPHLRAPDFSRWESKAAHDLFWPLRFAPLPNGELVTFLAGRCVGGTTTINTKVAFRAHERDVAKWHPASGLTSNGSRPFSIADIEPYYDRVEQVLGVRERSDWEKSVYTVEPGFRALGAELESVNAYTDANCTSCGSCIQGCASNAGKSTMNTYIADALARGALDLRAEATVERVVIEGSEATGVEYVDGAGGRHTVRAAAVVVAAGAGNGVAVITNAVLVQRGAPDRLRGRAFAVVMSLGYAFLGLGMIVAGPLTNAAGARTVWAVAAGLLAIAAVVGFLLARRVDADGGRVSVRHASGPEPARD